MIKFLYNTIFVLCLSLIAFLIIRYYDMSWQEGKISFDKYHDMIKQMSNINKEQKSESAVIYSSENRSIFIYGWIDNKNAKTVVEYLFLLEKTNGNISIYINSLGGYTSSVFQIIDAINTISCKVNTIGIGLCANGSLYLLISGTGSRLANKSCIFSLRNLKPPMGKYDLLYNNRINNILNKVNILKFNSKRIFFTTQDAIKYGIINSSLSVLSKN